MYFEIQLHCSVFCCFCFILSHIVAVYGVHYEDTKKLLYYYSHILSLYEQLFYIKTLNKNSQSICSLKIVNENVQAILLLCLV